MRVATWNINSLRLRLPLLRHLVDALDPDVLCLQETKVPDELFPDHGPAELGFPHVARRGMKGYNGVAVLSRLPLTLHEDSPDWCGRGDCRHLHVTVHHPSGPVELHDFYVPAGGDVPDRELNPKFAHKLDFMAQATAWFAGRAPLRRAVLVGDLNVAPRPDDVWSHRQLLDVVSHTPVEVEALERWLAAGFTDAMRALAPEGRLFTWWSYRNRDWRVANRGRRLDHVWISPDLRPGLRDLSVLCEARDWERGSDHVPVAVSVL